MYNSRTQSVRHSLKTLHRQDKDCMYRSKLHRQQTHTSTHLPCIQSSAQRLVNTATTSRHKPFRLGYRWLVLTLSQWRASIAYLARAKKKKKKRKQNNERKPTVVETVMHNFQLWWWITSMPVWGTLLAWSPVQQEYTCHRLVADEFPLLGPH